MRERNRVLMLTAVAGGAMAMAALGSAGCEEQGPAERAGERIDEGVEETGEALEDAADELDGN